MMLLLDELAFELRFIDGDRVAGAVGVQNYEEKGGKLTKVAFPAATSAAQAAR